MKLYLVRHGQTAANQEKIFQGWLDWPLNEEGQAEAVWLRDQLQGRDLAWVYTSPLLRAMETARMIVDGLAGRVVLEQVPALREMNFGLWDGLTSEQIAEKNPGTYQRWLDHWQVVAPPMGESAEDLHRRVTTWIDHLLEKNTDGHDLLIVSHEGVLLQIIVHLLGFKLDDCWRFRVKPGSLSVVEIHGGYATLVGLNQCGQIK